MTCDESVLLKRSPFCHKSTNISPDDTARRRSRGEMPPAPTPVPRALRVLHLEGRVVLHDVTHALRSTDPGDRNGLIDAANSATAARSPRDAVQPLVELGPPPAAAGTTGRRGRCLVLPFADDGGNAPPPYEVASPELAGVGPGFEPPLAVEAAAGFLGLLRLHSGLYCVIVSHMRRAGELPSGPILAVSRVKLIKLHAGMSSKEDRDFSAAVCKLLEGGALYYSLDCDLSRSLQKSRDGVFSRVGNAFWWTWPLARLLGPPSVSWVLRTVYGFVGTHLMRFSSDAMPTGAAEFNLTLISRRSRRRAGTRYITRGVDALGDVANFVETEQIVWSPQHKHVYSAFLTIRGSVPVFWRQTNGIARPSPELDGSLTASRAAFSTHFQNVIRSYGGVAAVSLVDKHGSESVLAQAFERHFELDLGGFDGIIAPKLVAFDFHAHCAGKEYERGLAALLSRIRDDVSTYGIFTAGLEEFDVCKQQRGVFRVNCVDCLDRTNVVQSVIARLALGMQLGAVFSAELAGQSERAAPRLYVDSEDRFKHVWGDNADAVSKQYSGTGALKTDFTRTGKRSTTGVIGDGVKSVMRMYYKNFVDEGRQEAIDILCGNAVVRPPRGTASLEVCGTPTATTSQPSLSKPSGLLVGSGSPRTDIAQTMTASPVKNVSAATSDAAEESFVWYAFDAQRMNAGGDKQGVLVELQDKCMVVSTPEGVRLDYPRRAVAAWSKYDDTKSSDRKQPSRLRLIYTPSTGSPAAASPLDLIFRGGSTQRENFLRAFLSWAQPPVAKDLGRSPIRVRTFAALSAGEHRMTDWGLDQPVKGRHEIVALVLPEGNAVTRSWGLAAVPIDIDDSEYVLISARAVSDRGPSIAILASKPAAPTVMSVSEAVVSRTGSLSTASGGAVAVSLLAGGASFCFVSARLSGAQEVYSALSSLKLGRPTFDITNQFEHFVVAGLLGEMQWRNRTSSHVHGPESRKWVQLADGATCYSLADGLSIMRNSFPTLKYEDKLSTSSLWNAGTPAARNGETIRSIALSDGLVDGRPAPKLPNALTRCVVTLSELQGEGIRMPPGVDQNTALNCFLVVYCDYCTTDGVVTRPTPRPTGSPEWRDVLRLVMMPSDPSDIEKGFLLGQILIPTPLADPIAAGYFVIPISTTTVGQARFDVPCRLAGISTGRLRGCMELSTQPSDSSTTNGATDSFGAGSSQPTLPASRTMPISGSSFGAPSPLPLSRVGQDNESARSGPMRRETAAMVNRVSSGLGGFAPGASKFASRPSRDEVNDKIDAARRKGSKQIKSVVSKLSSFLNQPSQSSTLSSQLESSNGGAVMNSIPAQRRRFESESEFPMPAGRASAASLPFEAEGRHNSAYSAESDEFIGVGVSRKSSTNEVAYDSDFEANFGGFQSAQSEPSRHTRPDALLGALQRNSDGKNALEKQYDPLLNNLTRRRTPTTTPDNRAVTAAGEDPLLSGLIASTQQVRVTSPAASDDIWGAFEAAPNAGDQRLSNSASKDSEQSLIDF